jgi:ABC-type transporter Mla subunit MlaD
MLTIDRIVHRRAALGAVVLVAAVAASWLAITKPDPTADPQRVWVVFDDATGISIIQRDVRVAGVRVGSIGDVRRVGDDAEVEMIFDPPIGEIRADAEAELLPHTPFEGTAYINLDPGSASAPPLGDAPIPKRQTSVYVSLDQAQRVLKKPNRDSLTTVIPEVGAALGDGGDRAVNDIVRSAPGLLRDAGPAARALRGPRGTELRSAMVSIDRTLEAINGDEPRLRASVADLRRTLGALTVDDGRALDEILTRLPGTLDRMPEMARQGERSLTQMGRAARALEPGLPELGRALREAGPVARQSTRVLPASAESLRGAAELLEATAALAPTLRDASTSLGRSGVRVDQTLAPMLKSESSLGLPVYLQLLMAFAGSTSQHSTFRTKEQSPMGWGHAQRGVVDYFTPRQTDEKEIP